MSYSKEETEDQDNYILVNTVESEFESSLSSNLGTLEKSDEEHPIRTNPTNHIEVSNPITNPHDMNDVFDMNGLESVLMDSLSAHEQGEDLNFHDFVKDLIREAQALPEELRTLEKLMCTWLDNPNARIFYSSHKKQKYVVSQYFENIKDNFRCALCRDLFESKARLARHIDRTHRRGFGNGNTIGKKYKLVKKLFDNLVSRGLPAFNLPKKPKNVRLLGYEDEEYLNYVYKEEVLGRMSLCEKSGFPGIDLRHSVMVFQIQRSVLVTLEGYFPRDR